MISWSVETAATCDMNISFSAKILVPGSPSVIKRTTHASLARFGDDHQTPLTLSIDLDAYLLYSSSIR